MEITQYKKDINNLPKKIEDIKFGVTIKELKETDSKILIGQLIFKHFTSNPKAANFLNPDQINVVTEFLLNDCGNLQIEEINIIFKNGILGRYGTIYGEITPDLICGIDGWIEKYYAIDRKKRNEVQEIPQPIYSGDEMSYDEWLEKNPEIKKQIRIKEIKKILKTSKARIREVIEYCELLGHNWDSKKEKLMIEYNDFEHKEMLSFEQWCIVFIKSKIK